MQKQYVMFLFCCAFFGSVSAMEHELKALSIQRAVSPPLAIPCSRYLTPQLRDDRSRYSEEEQLKHAHSPIRFYTYSPRDPNAFTLLATTISFGQDYSSDTQDDEDWPSQ
jgi:hypothetical protein